MDNVIDLQLAREKRAGAPLPAPTERPMLVVEFYRGESRHVRLRTRAEDGDVGPMAMREIAVEFQALQLTLLHRAAAMDGDVSFLPKLVLELYGDDHVEAIPMSIEGEGLAARKNDYPIFFASLFDFRRLLAELRQKAPE